MSETMFLANERGKYENYQPSKAINYPVIDTYYTNTLSNTLNTQANENVTYQLLLQLQNIRLAA